MRTPSETTPVYDTVRADLRRDPSEHARRAEHSYDALPSDIHRNVAADIYGTDFTPRHAQSVRGLSDLSLHQMHYANEVARRYPVPDPLERNIYMRQRIERETLTPPTPLRARLPEQR